MACYPGTEPMYDYKPGGYHPVHIGDVFHNKYCVLNKLGDGSSSTVWLVEDLTSGLFASLKILTARASETPTELDIIWRLRQNSTGGKCGRAGQEYVIEVWDDFQVKGPNGVHRCIVTELLGPNLNSRLVEIFEDFHYPGDMSKKMCAQLAYGLSYLHRCQIVHGDFNLSNILLRIPGVENWTREDVATYYGEPNKLPIADPRTGKPIPLTPNLPDYVVSEAVTLSDDLLRLCLRTTSTVHLKICDFSESFLWTNEPKNIELGTPRVFAAPEVIFNEPITPAADIWSLAVVMYGIPLGGPCLFPSKSHFGDCTAAVLCAMVLRLGKLPERLWKKWKERAEYFDDNGEFIGDVKAMASRRDNLLEHNIPRPFQMSKREGFLLIQLIRMMVYYEPQERLSADEVVRLLPEDWLNGPWEHIVYGNLPPILERLGFVPKDL